MEQNKEAYIVTDIIAMKLPNQARTFDKMKALNVLVNDRLKKEPGWTLSGSQYIINNVLAQQIVRIVPASTEEVEDVAEEASE